MAPSRTASPATTSTLPASTTFKARYYDANTGRFTQPDPSGQEKNPYFHAEGDPVNRIDPSGLVTWPSRASHACWEVSRVRPSGQSPERAKPASVPSPPSRASALRT
ncbi:RHS repeat-associated core domain-containing protein [Streptomyces longwoodensis]|uniref:RHS repeat-associated core domain-containing protein n=1 Tax=Streptomyces longwoodensis TaxID=68231 RepID=UPI003F5407B7